MTERPDAVLDTFISGFAKNAIAELSQESGQPIDVVVSQIERGKLVGRRKFTVLAARSNGKRATGEVRVKFRLFDGRGSFSAQAIFEALGAGTGFSGFAARGRIELDNTSQPIRITARSNRYNVWEWDSEFGL